MDFEMKSCLTDLDAIFEVHNSNGVMNPDIEKPLSLVPHH